MGHFLKCLQVFGVVLKKMWVFSLSFRRALAKSAVPCRAVPFRAVPPDAGTPDDATLSLDVLNCLSGHTLCRLVVPRNAICLELKGLIFHAIGVPLSQQKILWGTTPVETATKLCDLFRPDEEGSHLSQLQINTDIDKDIVPDDGVATLNFKALKIE